MSEPTTPPDDAVELLRAWLVNDSLECSVRAGVFADPAQTLRLIAEAFARELAEPSGESP